jgi:hypothetical protein
MLEKCSNPDCDSPIHYREGRLIRFRPTDAFNARDFAAVHAIHHPDIVAYITGNAQAIYGRAAHVGAGQRIAFALPG